MLQQLGFTFLLSPRSPAPTRSKGAPPRDARRGAEFRFHRKGPSGQAAELAGMPRVEFLLALGRYKVFPFQAELNDLEQHHA